LRAARDTFPEGPHGEAMGFKSWVKKSVGIGMRYAESLIAIADKFEKLAGKQKLPSFRVMQFLARATTPAGARREVMRRVKRGELVSGPKARAIADKHRPTPSEANKLAKETGKPVVASDGYIYFGTSKQKAKEGELRRTVVYSVRRAVECLATMELSPHQFLNFALPHQLWSRGDKQIGVALKWLNALHTAWETRRD
jgi:hypothetical protein